MTDSTNIIRSKKRRKTVALHVGADGRLSVQAPPHVSEKWIFQFIASRKDWIAKRRREIERDKPTALVLENGCPIPFRGQALTLLLSHDGYTPALKQGDTLLIGLEPSLDPLAHQAEIKTELTLFYKKQARSLFAEKLATWAAIMELTPSRLAICAPDRQWGSCNSKNEIRLNWHLILCDDSLLDYVIVHELSHIPHKDHSDHFWRHVARYIPDCKERRKTLRAFKGAAWLKA